MVESFMYEVSTLYQMCDLTPHPLRYVECFLWRAFLGVMSASWALLRQGAFSATTWCLCRYIYQSDIFEVNLRYPVSGV